MNEQPFHKPPQGYSKLPLWLWVVIHLVGAAIVYSIIYFVFIRGGSFHY